MSLLKPPKHKGQGALEYLLLCGIVGFVAILSFAPSGFLSKVSSTSKEYFSTITRVVQGDNPKPINGGWCKPVSNPGGATYRTCECPAPAFGGQPCQGDVLVAGAASGGPGAGPGPANPANNGTCGDGTLQPDHGEQCDQGANNGQVCAPDYGKTCAYCSSTCQSVSLFGGRCGDAAKQGAEDCDDGSSNGRECTPLYGQDCQYCSTDCKQLSKIGPKCGDEKLDSPQEQCDSGKNTNGVPCDPPFQSSCNYCDSNCQNKTLLGTHCGDEIVQTDRAEQCDEGPSKNGIACAVSYNGSDCVYCSLGCKNITNVAPKCGDAKADILNGEQCDGSENCLQNCQCNDVSYADGTGNCLLKCGNNRPDAGEECDTGTENGTECVPDYSGPNCFYCSTSCTKVTVAAKKCGDGITDILNAEECDKGASNGTVCVAEYGTEDCSYCSTQCKNITVTVAKCGDGQKDEGHEQCDGVANCNSNTCACDATSMPGSGNECILYTYTPKYADCPTTCDYTGGNLSPTTCTRDQDGADVALTNCPQTRICPASKTPCSSWKTGAWGACSACSRQTRSVVCEDPNHNVVNDSACTGAKPASVQGCVGGGCGGYGGVHVCDGITECICQYDGYTPMPFCTQYSGSDCIAYGMTCTTIAFCGDHTCNNNETCSTCAGDCGSCYTGTWTRGSCTNLCGSGNYNIVCTGGNSQCDPSLPKPDGVCQDYSACPGTWLQPVCSKACGGGVYDTPVCLQGPCDPNTMPNNAGQPCNTQSCYTGTWTQGACSTTCGTGTKAVTCVGGNGTCDPATRPQPEACSSTSSCTYTPTFGACPTACGQPASELSPISCTRSDGTSVNLSFCPGTKSCAATDICQVCGDGIRSGTEQCERGNSGCRVDCTCLSTYQPAPAPQRSCIRRCGNGVWDSATEQCDSSAGATNCTGCACSFTTMPDGNGQCVPKPADHCGNGVKESYEECDASDASSLPANCIPPIPYGQCNYCYMAPDGCYIAIRQSQMYCGDRICSPAYGERCGECFVDCGGC